MGDTLSKDAHAQRTLIDKQVKAFDREITRITSLINSRSHQIRVLMRNGETANDQEVKSLAKSIRQLQKEKQNMLNVVSRLQGISAEVIKVQSVEMMNDHMVQLRKLVSSTSDTLLIPELADMNREQAEFQIKSATLTEHLDDGLQATDNDDDDLESSNDEERKQLNAIVARATRDDTVQRLQALPAPPTHSPIRLPPHLSLPAAATSAPAQSQPRSQPPPSSSSTPHHLRSRMPPSSPLPPSAESKRDDFLDK